MGDLRQGQRSHLHQRENEVRGVLTCDMPLGLEADGSDKSDDRAHHYLCNPTNVCLSRTNDLVAGGSTGSAEAYQLDSVADLNACGRHQANRMQILVFLLDCKQPLANCDQ
jgi:hypothetical protein